jgi:hypothetical protein
MWKANVVALGHLDRANDLPRRKKINCKKKELKKSG